QGTKPEERARLRQEALDDYQALLPKLQDKKFAQRHVYFKIASLLARMAEEGPEQRDAAIEAVSKFQTERGDGWQMLASAKLVAGLREQAGDMAAVQKIYGDLANRGDLPKEVRDEFGLLEAGLLLHTNQAAAAK